MSNLSCGIIFVRDGKFLIGHVSGQTHWDLPKGKIENNERPIDAAIRETYEEAGIVTHVEYLTDLGTVPYRRGKQLHLFSDTVTKPSPEKCKDAIKLNPYKELDDFMYVDFSDMHLYLNPRMLRSIGRALLLTI